MSKFAVLHVEGLSSSSDDEEKKPNTGKANASHGKQKQKKKQQQQQPVPAVRKSKQQKKSESSTGTGDATALEEWAARDAKLTEATYQEQLAQAILESRLDAPKSSAASGAAAAAAAAAVSSGTLASLEAASRAAASQAVRREKASELDKVRREVEQELEQRHAEALAAKAAESEELRAELDSANQRLAASRAEVEHLSSLLALVEGKKAKGLAEQIYQLTCVIQELTDNTKELDSELSKERTRAHQLQEQLDRLKR